MTHPPISQTIAAIIGVSILCSLGTWQVQRLHWKDAMIAELEKDYTAIKDNKVAFVSPARLNELGREKQPMAIGKIRGRFLRDGAILLGPKPEDGRIGYHLLVPMEVPNGGTLIVNTGWVDAIWKDDLQDRLTLLPQDGVTVTGVLRKPDWNSFTSKNSPVNDMWFRGDIDEIAKAKNISAPYPFVLYASATNPPLHDIKPIEDHWLPRNKHLQYALFWFSMAVTLIGVYGFYWRSISKKT